MNRRYSAQDVASTDQRDSSRTSDGKGTGKDQISSSREIRKASAEAAPAPPQPQSSSIKGHGFEHAGILDRDPFEGQDPDAKPELASKGGTPDPRLSWDNFRDNKNQGQSQGATQSPRKRLSEEELAKTVLLPESEANPTGNNSSKSAKSAPKSRASAIEWPAKGGISNDDTVMTTPPSTEPSRAPLLSEIRKDASPKGLSMGKGQGLKKPALTGNRAAARVKTSAQKDPLNSQKYSNFVGADDTKTKPPASKIEQGKSTDNTSLDTPGEATKIGERETAVPPEVGFLTSAPNLSRASSPSFPEERRRQQHTVDSRSLNQAVPSEEHELVTPPDTERKDRSGEILGERYELVKRIGIGGMGTVYKAIHRTILRSCAVKVLDGPYMRHPDFISRLTREAQAASVLRHPNIVDVSDFGRTDDGSVFLVMEYLEGEDLSHTLAREQLLSWPRTRHIVLQILQALEIAHAHGIVHRDIKLENCFRLTKNNDDDFIKVLDFGNAKEIDPPLETEPTFVGEARRARTAMGTIVGTAAYLSPEHAQQRKVDQRSDLYAVGIVLFELLTGQLPFEDESFVRVLTHHIHTPVPSLKKTNCDAEVTPEIEALIQKLLEKEPDDRFQDASSTIEALLKIPADAFEQRNRTDVLLPPPAVEGPSENAVEDITDNVAKAGDSSDQPGVDTSATSDSMSQTWDDALFGAGLNGPRRHPAPRAGVGDKLGVPIRAEDEKEEMTEVMGMGVGTSTSEQDIDEYELEQLESKRRRRKIGWMTGAVALLGLLAWGLPAMMSSSPSDAERAKQGPSSMVVPSSAVSVGSPQVWADEKSPEADPSTGLAAGADTQNNGLVPADLDTDGAANAAQTGSENLDLPTDEGPSVGPDQRKDANESSKTHQQPSDRRAARRERLRKERLARKNRRNKQADKTKTSAGSNPKSKEQASSPDTAEVKSAAKSARFSSSAIKALNRCAREHGRIPGDKFRFVVDTNTRGQIVSTRVIARRASAGLSRCLSKAVRGSELQGVHEAKRSVLKWRFKGG